MPSTSDSSDSHKRSSRISSVALLLLIGLGCARVEVTPRNSCERTIECRDGFVCFDRRCVATSDSDARSPSDDAGPLEAPVDAARPVDAFVGMTDAAPPRAPDDGGVPSDARLLLDADDERTSDGGSALRDATAEDSSASSATGHGAPCETASSCGLGEAGLCLRETSRVGSFPGGYCATRFLLVCPRGSEAWLVDFAEEAWCVAGCERSSDCREGYVCGTPETGSTFGDTTICRPDGA